MIKIVLCSDNHYNFSILEKIVEHNKDADYFWHLGDSEFENNEMLKPFVGVRGNNDFYLNLPDMLTIEVSNHRFLLTHGARYTFQGLNRLYYLARENNCDVVLYGHTHNPDEDEIDGIKFINPGSCNYNRGFYKPTYMLLYVLDDGTIKVELKILE